MRNFNMILSIIVYLKIVALSKALRDFLNKGLLKIPPTPPPLFNYSVYNEKGVMETHIYKSGLAQNLPILT